MNSFEAEHIQSCFNLLISQKMLLSHGGTVQSVNVVDIVELRDQSKPEEKRYARNCQGTDLTNN